MSGGAESNDSRILLRLHRHRVSLRAPEGALRLVSLLYHDSLIESGGAEGKADAGFALTEHSHGWELTRVGSETPLGRFRQPLGALLKLEHAVEGLVLESLQGAIALHAGAVAVGSHACLLAGCADTGKSSSTFQMVELGHTFLAEEIAVVDSSGRVRPHLQSLALDPRVVEEFERHHSVVHGRLDRVDDVLTRYMPARARPTPLRLGTIVLPAYRPGAPPRVEELEVSSVLTELLGYCFEPEGDPEPAIDRVIELAVDCRIVSVAYPDADAARRCFAELFGAGAP